MENENQQLKNPNDYVKVDVSVTPVDPDEFNDVPEDGGVDPKEVAAYLLDFVLPAEIAITTAKGLSTRQLAHALNTADEADLNSLELAALVEEANRRATNVTWANEA